ncbi:MAG: carboxypeptidase-like regulatory domain-containing protein [Anaerolineae bacterium]
MKLSEYPRPPADNGRGIHWSPSQYQWGRQDWLKWQKRILELGFKWIKVNVPPDYNAEAIVKRLVDIEVMPVCRFIRKNPTRVGGAVEQTIERLVKLGARYFETNNEPDANVEWEGYRRPPRWEELVIKNLIHDANRLYNLGACPAFVAFNCGPTESRNPIQILLDQPGGRDIFDKGPWVSLHNYGKGRPFNYPNDRVRMFGDPVSEAEWLDQGQPDFWSDDEVVEFVWHNMTRDEVNRLRQQQKNPNITIMEDITCFRAYEYWNRLITQEGLDSIPIMMTEGGWETGDRLDPFYPEPPAQRASELNFQMFRFIQGDIDMTTSKPDGSAESSPVPDYLFAVMPWHMGEKEFGLDTSGQWEQGAWFTHWYDQKFGLNGELPIIQMLRDLPTNIRADGPVPPEWSLRRGIAPDVDAWDYRLVYLGEGIRVQAADTNGPRWKVESGLWQAQGDVNPDQALPPGYIMVKVLDETGDPIPDAAVEILRPGDDDPVIDTIMTKGEPDHFLGNYRMSATLGTYTVSVSHRGYPSDRVQNVGLGGEEPDALFDQSSFLFTFRLRGVTPPDEETAAGETPVEVPAADESQPPPAVNNAAHLGVKILPIKPSPVCAVLKIDHLGPDSLLAPNTLYLDVLDQAGERAYGTVVLVKDATGQTLRVAIEKPSAEPGGNMPMWPNNTYTIAGVEMEGQQILAETVTGLQAVIPNHGDGHSFLVVFQLR